MRRSFMLVLLMVLFFTGCTPSQQTVILKPNGVSGIEGEKFQEFKDNDTSVDKFYLNGGEVEAPQSSAKSRTAIERIPNFQANEFKSVKTANRATVKKDIQVSGGKVKVNVESIPLNEFVDFIFSSVLKMNYTVDKNIKTMKQPITLNMAKALPKKQVFMVVKNILKNEQVGVRQEDGTLFVSKLSTQKASQGLSDQYMVLGRELSLSLKDTQKVIVFVPFYYTKPTALFSFSKRLKINKVKISYLNKNIAVLAGEAFDVRQLLELVNIMDSPSMDQKVPYLLELEYIDVKKFAERMKSILKSNAIPIATSIREVGMVLTPIEETNTLLVLSSKESWIKMLSFWKDKLDVMSEVDTEHTNLYIYKVKHRKADELAELLHNLLTIKNSNTESSIQSNTNSMNRSNADSNQTTDKKQQLGTTIQSDLHTNSIMLNITPAQYKKILPVIKKLDDLPLQVSVEVILAEVTMTDTFSLGFEWGLLNNKAITGTATQVSGAYSLALGGTGVTSNLFTNNLTSIINAFAEKKQLDILSRPRLVILNNETGTINIGQQIPVLSSETSSVAVGTQATLTPVQNITYIPTGMTLDLIPTINSNGTLTMEISITLSEAQTNQTSGIDSPLIVNRSLTTSAVMQSGNSILLGGIISHNKSDGNAGVPLLKNIPWIGNIFKSQSKSHVKTELIILIKPKILKSFKDANQETNNFKILLKNIKNIVNY